MARRQDCSFKVSRVYLTTWNIVNSARVGGSRDYMPAKKLFISSMLTSAYLGTSDIVYINEMANKKIPLRILK